MITEYIPLPHQAAFHASQMPYLLLSGPRGIGKTETIKQDVRKRGSETPSLRYPRLLVLCATPGRLKRTYLRERESGGTYEASTQTYYWPEGFVQYAACTEEALRMVLRADGWDVIYLDEAAEFLLDDFLMIVNYVTGKRSGPRPKPVLLRCATSPLTAGRYRTPAFAHEALYRCFITKIQEGGWYRPDEWDTITASLGSNAHLPRRYSLWC